MVTKTLTLDGRSKQEIHTLADDYGGRHLVQLPADSDRVEENDRTIDEEVAAMEARERRFEVCARKRGIDPKTLKVKKQGAHGDIEEI